MLEKDGGGGGVMHWWEGERGDMSVFVFVWKERKDKRKWEVWQAKGEEDIFCEICVVGN